MNVIRKTVLTAMLSVMAGQIMAANDSVEIHVIGQLVPVACAPFVTGGGTVNYGGIKADTIKQSDYNMLPVKSLELTITCEAPMKMALTVFDNRADSVEKLTGKSWEIENGSQPADGTELGLSKSGKNNIGAWAMWLEPDSIKVDGNSVDPIYTPAKPTEDTKWIKHKSGTTWLAKQGDYTSWAAPGSFTPLALTTLNAKLSIQAGINKGSELDLTNIVMLNGLANIQVYYL